MMIAGATPIRTSVNANVVDGATTTRSHAAISPTPPARTGPFTAAIVGRSLSLSRFSAFTIGDESTLPVPRSLRSAPAQNVVPVWVRTIARGGRGLGDVECAMESRTRPSESALRFAGESSVIVATRRSTTT